MDITDIIFYVVLAIFTVAFSVFLTNSNKLVKGEYRKSEK